MKVWQRRHTLKEQVVLRPMTLKDLPQVMDIEKRSYTAPWGEYLYRSELQNTPSAFYTVATIGDQIVGYAGMRLYKSQEGHLMTMVVNPDYRGLGIGGAILSYKINMMKEKKANSIFLEVRKSNAEAQHLYRKHGFVETGLKERYYPDNGEAALIMTLGLHAEVQSLYGRPTFPCCCFCD